MRGDTGSHFIALVFTILTVAGLEGTVQGVITAVLLAAFLVAYLLGSNHEARPIVLLGIGEVVALSTGAEGFPLALQLLLLGLILREQHLLVGLRSIGLFFVFSAASIGFVAVLQGSGSPLAALPIVVATVGVGVLAVAISDYRQRRQFAGDI